MTPQKLSLATDGRYIELSKNDNHIIALYDLVYTILYISPSAETILGHHPDELIGRKLFDIVHPDDRDRVSASLRILALRPDEYAGTSVAYRALTKDRREVWLEAKPKAQIDPKTGRATRFQDVVLDITSQKIVETNLELKRAHAEAASAAATEFLANMSHEIRTSLGGIIGFSALLNEERDLPPDIVRSYAGKIAISGRTLLAIVNDILSYSKIESGQFELDPHDFDPAAFIQDTMDLVAMQAHAKGLAIKMHIEPSASLPVFADSSRLRQVLLNLITNAIKFTATGHVEIAVRTQDGDPRRLYFAVSDTGAGIPETLRGRLFKRFSQIDGPNSRAHGGTGLGLAISKSLVALMGGDITVEDRPGGGSTFWFTIAAPLATADKDPVQPAPCAQTVRPAHILITDDLPTNRELVRAMLRPFGHTFEDATSGEEAVTAAMQRPFDLILMDMHMPGIGGLSATRAIRATCEMNKDTPIIALSADVLDAQIAACSVAGMDDHIAKPMTPLDLLEKVTRWCAPRPAATTQATQNEGLGK
jgi:PAS domain S-box-containing protein